LPAHTLSRKEFAAHVLLDSPLALCPQHPCINCKAPATLAPKRVSAVERQLPSFINAS
jgi:hypothetical protein